MLYFYNMKFIAPLFVLIFSFGTISAKKMLINELVIQPSFWWTDMKWDTVSFLLHSPNGIKEVKAISRLNKIISTNKINDKYTILKVIASKRENISVTGIDNNGIPFRNTIPIYNDTSNYEPKGFSPSDLVYLIMPDRFANGNPDNDTVPGMEPKNRANVGGRHGGDLQGIINHLDYIKKLGVTAIWLTPFQEMNDKSGSYHGYGMSNLYQTDPRYALGKTGFKLETKQNLFFQKYCEEVHKNNMKIIMDVVPNHIGIAHPWMNPTTSLPEWIHDSAVRCNFEMTSLTDPYSTTRDRDQMEKGWFVPSMPDLNQQNQDLCNYLIQCHIWWIKTMHIDGLRIDTQPFNDRNFMTQWATALKQEFPQLSLVGENWCVINNVLFPAYYQANAKNSDGYNSQIESVMDFPIFENIITSLNNNDFKHLYRTLGQDFVYADASKNFVFLGNHDTERFFTSIKENYAKFKQGIILNATLRGIPQLYYGDEILMTGVKGINDGIMRKDMPGGWPDDTFNIFENPLDNEAYNFTSQVFNWRKGQTILHKGTFKHQLPQNNVYAYSRTYKNKSILVLLNANAKESPINLENYKDLVVTYKKWKIATFEDNSKTSKENLSLPANGYLVLELE